MSVPQPSACLKNGGAVCRLAVAVFSCLGPYLKLNKYPLLSLACLDSYLQEFGFPYD